MQLWKGQSKTYDFNFGKLSFFSMLYMNQNKFFLKNSKSYISVDTHDYSLK